MPHKMQSITCARQIPSAAFCSNAVFKASGAELRVLCKCRAGHCVVLQSRFEDAGDAAAIITRGPEPLQSQFRSGYGMALNLLHSRSLDAARAFIQRSFNNYLGVVPFRPFSEPSPLARNLAFPCPLLHPLPLPMTRQTSHLPAELPPLRPRNAALYVICLAHPPAQNSFPK